MKHNWKYKKLGEVCTVIGGSTPRTDVPEYWDGDINWFTPAEINDQKYYFSSDRKISKVAVTSSGLTLLPQGTVLLTSRAPIGKVGILCQEGYCNQGFKNLVCKEELYNEYLYYTLIYFKKEIEEKGRGATFKEISKKVTESIEIPVPPMEVQARIAAELDKLNEVIATKRDQIKQLDLLAQSIFYDTFGDPVTNPKGWQKLNLKDVASVKIGPFGSLLHKEDYVNNGTPLVNPVHMKDKKVCTDNDFTISADKLKEMTSYRLKTGDVIFGRRGDIGRCALITEKENGYICGTGSLFIRFNIEIDPCFSIWCFSQPNMKDWLIEQAKGATMLNINCGIVERIKIILPPLSLQQQFAKRIEAIETQKSQIEESIKELQTLLDSRMDYWFN